MSSNPVIRFLQSPQWLGRAGLLGFLTCAALLATAYYFEYVLYMEPCPMCMVQRLAFLLIGLGCLAVFFARNHYSLRLVTLALTVAAAIFGYWSADHHVWLQNLPPEEVPDCGPSFGYLMDTLPLTELLKIMLQGNGNCAEISWSMWGLSMPEWTRIWYAGFALVVGTAFFSNLRRD
ncbi:disulfide bond formation protein B [Bacterioplanes sanyensis]|uniref:disulfide bond formation protein B n=1 Tax=Bacterioplanes sanyensis TaxID=1249553 RepID=UPI00167766E5|nr:disulfide bond formation protein B [Bacterioplanes sanyensis]GGY51031.1 disulfide bond formation protein B [Bacterioplanes sanyensis]